MTVERISIYNSVMEQAVRKKVFRHLNGSSECVEDLVALEKKVRVSVNGKEILSLYCTPHMVRELVVGFIVNEGIIKGSWCADRMRIEYGDDILIDIPAEGEVSTNGRTVTSGCLGGVTFSGRIEDEPVKDTFTIDGDALVKVFREFQQKSEFYKSTGCIHSAALSDGKTMVAFAEDIGRHNAVDKVIGYAILEDISFSGKVLLASGRISSEISLKCARRGIPVLATRAAPTHLAIEIAQARGVTVVGFVRGSRFNVYTHPERIK